MIASEQIDIYSKGFTDWRGETLSILRKVIHTAEPDILEEWKWDVPIFSHGGMVCAISAFKEHVKINFFKGAQLQDPAGLINAGLESKAHRSIDFFEGDGIKEKELVVLMQVAVALNNKKK